jgi:starch-binding outer membrane protein SusE/F
MRNKFIIFITIIGLVFFFSCKKEDHKVTIKEDVTAMGLSPLSASSFVLALDNASSIFQSFTWTSADYGFKAAITYKLQVDVSSDNFAAPQDIATVIKDTAIINVGDLNKALINLGLDPDVAATVQFRVKAWVNDSVAPVYSNIVDATITPYATSFPPIYMCGDATGGWSWDKSVEVRSTAPSIYGTIVYLTNNGAFRFFKQKDWSPTSYNYPYFTGTVSSSFQNAGDGDSNFKYTGTTGYYQITVNMKAKTVALEAVAEPKMFMIGNAVNGWDTGTAIKMTWQSDGIFKATTTFTKDGAFRFFAQQDWGPNSYNFPYFTTVDALFANANDGDKNFKFTGATGSYTITLNMFTKTVVMTQP